MKLQLVNQFGILILVIGHCVVWLDIVLYDLDIVLYHLDMMLYHYFNALIWWLLFLLKKNKGNIELQLNKIDAFI